MSFNIWKHTAPDTAFTIILLGSEHAACQLRRPTIVPFPPNLVHPAAIFLCVFPKDTLAIVAHPFSSHAPSKVSELVSSCSTTRSDSHGVCHGTESLNIIDAPVVDSYRPPSLLPLQTHAQVEVCIPRSVCATR
jgi:hypothetical protein